MEQIVKDFIKDLGFEDAIDENQETRVNNWLNWYKGKTKDYNYYVYNGKNKIKRILKSLYIIQQSCEDISDFYFNEKLDIEIDKDTVSEKIHKALEQNDFLYNANKLMQLTKALGTGAMVPYLDNDILKINFIDATGIVILEADKSNVKSVLFWSKVGKDIIINAHILTEEGYVIENRRYRQMANGYEEIELDEATRHIETKSFIPRFAMIYNTAVNNLDINSPYGISVYANSLDNVLAIDTAYDSLDNEISSGKKRIYIKGGAIQFNTDESGNMTPIFDNTDTVFYQVPGTEKDPLVSESNGELRVESITNSLQSQLNLYTAKVGLGHNYYKFKDGEVYTNKDQVMSANSDVYRKIKKQENIITYALKDLVYAIASLIGIDEEFSISVDYDDTIIENTDNLRLQAMQEYNAGLISKQEYFTQVYNMNEATAKKFTEEMEEQQKSEKLSGVEEEPIFE